MNKLFFHLILIIPIYAEVIKINLITTNDMHGSISSQQAYFMNPQYPPKILGGAAFSKYVDNIRNEAKQNNEGIIILDGGNFFQGSSLGLMDDGQTMVEWMNRIGYDALVPGQYDFVFGTENFNNILNHAKFDILGSNVKCNDCLTKIKPYIIKEIKGIKIGILGVVNSAVSELVPQSRLNELIFDFEVSAIKKWVPEIKKNGADVIIVLTSSGIPWDRDEVYEDFVKKPDEKQSLNAIQMGYYINDVDLIVSGGISKGYNTAWYDPKSHVYTIQNYGNGTSFGHIQLKIDSDYNKFSGIEYVINNQGSHTLFSDDFIPDKKAQEWIDNKILALDDPIYFNQPQNINYINDNSDNWKIPSINTEEGIEVITWNCEFFPTSNDSTIQALSEAVKDLDADIIAFQEIRKAGPFEKLMQRLPEYDYIISLQASFMDLAIIYKKNIFDFKAHTELFSDNDYNFAGRPPLKLDLVHNKTGKEFSVINLHMKCCDSGLKRRQKAAHMLYEYLDFEIANNNTNFIVLGDWNDDLKDKEGEHCFDSFLSDNRFYFTNHDIVDDISQATYPKEPYVSFLDHILVTKSLVNRNFINMSMTIPIDDYMNGYNIYEAYISDHKPVLLSFNID